jgi:hypothetical protein
MVAGLYGSQVMEISVWEADRLIHGTGTVVKIPQKEARYLLQQTIYSSRMQMARAKSE